MPTINELLAENPEPETTGVTANDLLAQNPEPEEQKNWIAEILPDYRNLGSRGPLALAPKFIGDLAAEKLSQARDYLVEKTGAENPVDQWRRAKAYVKRQYPADPNSFMAQSAESFSDLFPEAAGAMINPIIPAKEEPVELTEPTTTAGMFKKVAAEAIPALAKYYVAERFVPQAKGKLVEKMLRSGALMAGTEAVTNPEQQTRASIARNMIAGSVLPLAEPVGAAAGRAAESATGKEILGRVAEYLTKPTVGGALVAGTDIAERAATGQPQDFMQTFANAAGFAGQGFLGFPGSKRKARAAIEAKQAAEAAVARAKEVPVEAPVEAAVEAASIDVAPTPSKRPASGPWAEGAIAENLRQPVEGEPPVFGVGIADQLRQTKEGGPNRQERRAAVEAGLAGQPAPEPMTMVQEIRAANARTRAEIQALFPEKRWTREELSDLRDLAWKGDPLVEQAIAPAEKIVDASQQAMDEARAHVEKAKQIHLVAGDVTVPLAAPTRNLAVKAAQTSAKKAQASEQAAREGVRAAEELIQRKVGELTPDEPDLAAQEKVQQQQAQAEHKTEQVIKTEAAKQKTEAAKERRIKAQAELAAKKAAAKPVEAETPPKASETPVTPETPAEAKSEPLPAKSKTRKRGAISQKKLARLQAEAVSPEEMALEAGLRDMPEVQERRAPRQRVKAIPREQMIPKVGPEYKGEEVPKPQLKPYVEPEAGPPRIAKHPITGEQIFPGGQREMVQLANELLQGKNVRAVDRKKLGGANGMVRKIKGENVLLVAKDQFGDQAAVGRTIGHEIGHVADIKANPKMGEHETIKRGNLTGRLMTMRNYIRETFSAPNPNPDPNGPPRQDILHRNRVYRRELMKVSQMWRGQIGGSAKHQAYRRSSHELYADALSVLLNDPALLETQAPKFYRRFFENLHRKPEVMEAYERLQGRAKATPGQRADELIADLKEGYRQAGEKRRESVAKNRAARESKWRGVIRETVGQFVDKAEAVIRVQNRLQREGKDVSGEKNFSRYYDDSLFSSEKDRIVQERRHVVDTAKQAGLDEMDVGAYVELARVANEVREKQIAHAFGMTRESAREAMQVMETRMGPEKAAALKKALQPMRDRLLRNMEEMHGLGWVTDQQMNEVVRPNADWYAPFGGIDYASEYMPAGIKEMHGTLQGHSNPLDTMAIKAMAQEDMISVSKMKRSTKLLFDDVGEGIPAELTRGPGGELLPKETRPDKYLLITAENGKPVGTWVEPAVGRFYDQVGRDYVNYVTTLWDKTIGRLDKPVRSLWLAYNPVFWWQTNPIKDTMRTARNLPTQGIKGQGIPKFASMMKQRFDPKVREAARAYTSDNPMANPIVADMILNKEIVPYEGTMWVGKPASAKDQLLMDIGALEKKAQAKWVQKIAPMLEWPSKMAARGEFKGKLMAKMEAQRAGMRGDDLLYFVRSLGGTPNYHRGGEATPITNRIAMFSNIAIQGARADMALLDPRYGVKSAAGAAFRRLMVVLPIVLYRQAAKRGYLGDWMQQQAQHSDKFDRDNYLLMYLPEAQGVQTKRHGVADLPRYYRLPLDEWTRIEAGAMDRMFDTAIDHKNPVTGMSEVLGYGADQLPGLAPQLTAIKDASLAMMGTNPYDYFRGKTVVPETEWEAGNRAPYVAEHVGRTFGLKNVLPTTWFNRVFKQASEYSLDNPTPEQEAAKVAEAQAQSQRYTDREKFLSGELPEAEARAKYGPRIIKLWRKQASQTPLERSVSQARSLASAEAAYNAASEQERSASNAQAILHKIRALKRQ